MLLRCGDFGYVSVASSEEAVTEAMSEHDEYDLLRRQYANKQRMPLPPQAIHLYEYADSF